MIRGDDRPLGGDGVGENARRIAEIPVGQENPVRRGKVFDEIGLGHELIDDFGHALGGEFVKKRTVSGLDPIILTHAQEEQFCISVER